MEHITSITLDVAASSPRRHLVTAKQGDTNTRIIEVTLLNDGKNFDIPAGSLVKIRMEKPDGKYIYNECSYAGNTVRYTLTNQSISVAGSVLCDIEIEDYLHNTISSIGFTMEVYRSPYSESAIKSANEMNVIIRYISTAAEYVEAARKYAEAAEAVVGIGIATYDRAGIVMPDQETLIIDPISGKISAKGAVADLSSLVLLKGFRTQDTTFNEDGSITEVDYEGYTKVTRFVPDGTISETFSKDGKDLYIKTTSFDGDIIHEKVTFGEEETNAEN